MNKAQKLIRGNKNTAAIIAEMRNALCEHAAAAQERSDYYAEANIPEWAEVYAEEETKLHKKIKEFNKLAKQFQEVTCRIESYLFFVDDYAFSNA